MCEAESADLIGTAAQNFAHQLQVPKVGVLALSFSGGLALLAASDPRYSQSIAWVATVGAHYDLAHVLRFFATGEAVRPDGSVEHLPPHEYGPLIVVYDEVQDFFAPQDVAAAHEAIRLLLSGKGKASEELAKTLTPAGQETMQRIYHKQREHFAPALLPKWTSGANSWPPLLPQVISSLFTCRFCCCTAPTTLSSRRRNCSGCERDIPKDELLDALISSAITHVEVGSKVTLRERLALVHWMALMIHEARATEAGQSQRKLLAGAWLALVDGTTH